MAAPTAGKISPEAELELRAQQEQAETLRPLWELAQAQALAEVERQRAEEQARAGRRLR